MLDGHVADDVLATLLALDVDVAFRSLLMQRKCEEMERILRSVGRLRAQRVSVHEKEVEQQSSQLDQVHETMDQVIHRARRIRIEMTRLTDQEEKDGDDSNEEKEETKDGETKPRSLQEILAMAQSIRDVPSASKATVTSAPVASVVADPKPRLISVDYPRKWKALIDQYEEMQARNREESFRFQFCRKLSEHVSMKSMPPKEPVNIRSNDKSPPPSARVQVSFSKQASRLAQAYRLLGTFVDSNLSMGSENCQKAITAPSLSTVIPSYRRLQHAKTVQRILESETNDLAQRMPPHPALSPEACSLRDQTLRRIRRKQGHSSPSTPTAVHNRNLLLPSSDTTLHEHAELLSKLQAAWDVQDEDTSSPSTINAFSNTVSETVLTAMSSLILRTFQMNFCEGEIREVKPSQVKDMMLLVRLVDSVCKSNGRAYRSVIAMRSPSEKINR